MRFSENILSHRQMKAIRGGYGGDGPTIYCYDNNNTTLGSGSVPSCECTGMINYCQVDLRFPATTSASCSS